MADFGEFYGWFWYNILGSKAVASKLFCDGTLVCEQQFSIIFWFSYTTVEMWYNKKILFNSCDTKMLNF